MDSDSEDDGLDNWEEIHLSFSDPNIDDMDGDGLLDGEEYIGFPLTDIQDEDCDDDKFSDKEEREIGTNPWNSDSDGDGYADYQEYRWRSDPLDSKSTPDGLLYFPLIGDFLLIIMSIAFIKRLKNNDVKWINRLKEKLKEKKGRKEKGERRKKVVTLPSIILVLLGRNLSFVE